MWLPNDVTGRYLLADTTTCKVNSSVITEGIEEPVGLMLLIYSICHAPINVSCLYWLFSSEQITL